jgi:hypothetical protein
MRGNDVYVGCIAAASITHTWERRIESADCTDYEMAGVVRGSAVCLARFLATGRRAGSVEVQNRSS